MVNIRDVAKIANLSVATVSRYLNKNGYVSEKSMKKIEQAINQLDYKPNSIARSLSKKKSNLIGLILPDIKNPYFPELARAVEDTAWKYDYTVVLCNSDEQEDKEILYIERLAQKYVAGLIVTTCLVDTSIYTNINTPIVALDRMIDESIPTVSTNNFEGSKIGAQHLIRCGARKVLYLRGPKGLKTADDRLAGFLSAVEGENMDVTIVEAGFSFQSAAEVVEQELRANEQYDSIFASSDSSAIAALKIAHTLGKKVPEELQVIGFDGITLGEMISPALTTVGQDLYELGAAATEMLIAQIEGKADWQASKYIDAQLIVRGTTRKEATV